MPPSAADYARMIQARTAERRAAIVAGFTALYGRTGDAAAQLEQLFAEIEAAAHARPDWLRRRDSARAAQPGTLFDSGQLGYSAYVERFGGTLAGVQARIPYLRELGVTYLHLLPFWQKRSGDSDGGFAVADHERVDPALGNAGDLLALTRALSDAGITLCGDFVLNHTADDHRWAQAAKAGDPHYQAYYRLFPSRTEPDRFERDLAQVFPDTAPGNFTWIAGLNQWAWTTFYPYQWDLNWANPQVLVEMLRIILRLANDGIGALRLDSAPFLWKRLGTNCQNQPETHAILRLIRAATEITAPSLILKAEAVVPARDLPAYFGLPDAPGQECHLAYQTSLMSASWAAVAHQDTSLLRAVLTEMPVLGEAGTWLTYIRCHDDIGWRVLWPECLALGDAEQSLLHQAADFFTRREPGHYPRGIAFQTNGLVATNGMTASLTGIEAGIERGDAALVGEAIDRVLLLYALILSVGGLPVIYMGDELGQMNSAIPAGEVDGRGVHRPFFDPAAAARRHDPDSIPGRIFGRLTALTRIRRGIPDLRADRPLRLLAAPPGPLCGFQRGAGFLALFNFSDQAQRLTPALVQGAARDLLRGQEFDAAAPIEPWSFRWLSLTP